MKKTRREFLRMGKLFALLPFFYPFIAQSRYAYFTWVFLKWGNLSTGEKLKNSVLQLLKELEKRTSVVPNREVLFLSPDSPYLLYYPFTCIAGSDPFSLPPSDSIKNLRSYLNAGGFIYIEDTSGNSYSPFYTSVLNLISAIYPQKEPVPINVDEHPVYRSFYLLDRVRGRFNVNNLFLGVWEEDRTPILISQNDVIGAVLESPVSESALRVLINVVMYSITINYKFDQVHQPFLIERLKRMR